MHTRREKQHGCLNKLKRMPPSPDEAQAEAIAQEIDSENAERASNFSFSKCKIPVGDQIEMAK